jgi:hypothetical protein
MAPLTIHPHADGPWFGSKSGSTLNTKVTKETVAL